MATIGAYTVTGWQGRLRPATQRISIQDAMPGVDGSVATLGSWRSDPTEIITRVDVNTINEAIDLINGYRLLGGQSVNVVDQFTIPWSLVFQAATPVSDYDLLLNGKYRVTTRWVMVTQSSDPTA